MDITERVYRVTYSFSREEKYEIVKQMRRSAVSIASNIAEGSYKRTRNDFVHFLSIARGSLGELETQLEISLRMNWVIEESEKDLIKQMDDLMKMLFMLIENTKEKGKKSFYL